MIVECDDESDRTATASTARAVGAATPIRTFAMREVVVRRWEDRPGLIERGALLRRLEGIADDVSLALVVAPPGYGKTIALSQWTIRGGRSFVWVTLQPRDNDPQRLLLHVARAVRPIVGVDDALWRALDDREDSTPTAAATRLLDMIHASGRRIVLILDDLDVLYDSAAQELVVDLAAGLHPGCHLVAASRSRPGLKLSRLRSQGKCVEFGPRDLAFSTSETRDALVAAGVVLPDDGMRALARRTEGWPAGVHVAALSLQGRNDPAAAAAELTGSDANIVDYFRTEVLARLSVDSARFLLQTAALDQMSGPLCDAVLERTGSGPFLADLEGRNLFVIPQDRDGHWYRYHRLFGEMLLSELRRREPGADLRLRRRAAAWYEERAMPRQAIASALAGEDIRTASRLICTHGQTFVNLGLADLVRGWLDTMDEGALESYPPLAVAGAWIWAYNGEVTKALRAVSAAERGRFDGRPPDGTSSLAAGIAVIRAALAPDGVQRMLVDAEFAFDREPPGSSWHCVSSLLLGVGYLLNGSPGPAAKALERAAYYGRGRQHVGAGFALGQLALLAAGQDDWPAAETFATESWTLLEAANLHELMPSVIAYVARAVVAAHQRDTAAANHFAGGALRLYARPSPVAFPWLGGQAAIALGRVCLDLGDRPAAMIMVREARRHLSRLGSEGILRDQLNQLTTDVWRDDDQPHNHRSLAITAAEVRILHLLPTHLSLAEIALELHVSRNTVKAHVAALHRKLHVSTRAEAVRRAGMLGLLER